MLLYGSLATSFVCVRAVSVGDGESYLVPNRNQSLFRTDGDYSNMWL